MTGWVIRNERPEDANAIRCLIARAFANKAFSDGSEPEIVERLRNAGALAISLVCEIESKVAGHVAFSEVAISDGSNGWYGLGPVSVEPSLQAHGIGTALVRAGLERLMQKPAQGCVVLGEPRYYRRFNFEHDPKLEFPGPPPQYFQRLVFKGLPPQGVVSYHSAFGG